MKKTITTVLCSVCTLAILGAPVKTPETATLSKKYVPISSGAPMLTPLKSQPEKGSSAVTNYVLIDEHFDGLKEGTQENPSETPLMDTEDFYAGRGIDQNLIGGGSWTAVNAYSADGAIALVNPSMFSSSYINTPVGDYSGEITLSFRAKPLENNGQKKSYIDITPEYGDYRAYNQARYKALTPMSFNLYAGDENWTEVEIKFENYTSDNEGFIQIACDLGTAVLIDDLKVTTRPTIVADPVLKPAEFGTNTLTAHWQPVRRAFDYWLYLYKKLPVGEGNAQYEEDFDNIQPDGSNLPEGWTFNVKELQISENGGYDGSQGIILRNNETLETFKNGAKYINASMWIKSYYPNAEAAQADQGVVALDVCKDGKWFPFAGYYMGELYEQPGEDDMETLADMYWTTFADKYDAIRVRIADSNCPEAYVVVDHFYIETGQPVTYELIVDKDGYDYSTIEDDKFEIKFENQDKNYPYHGLKQDCDYAYFLQSHYLNDISEGVFADLSGVYTPEADKAEETSDGFKGAWNEVYAATAYRADYYGVKTLKNDTENQPVFEEKFDRTVCPTTSPLYPEELGNSEVTDLSQYSDLPGWGGMNNVYVNGMMGFSGGYVITPLINVPNADTAVVRVVYYAQSGDILKMTDADGNVYYHQCTGTSDMNRTEAEFIVPVGSKPLEFTIRSDYRLPILIDEFTVLQDAKAGNKIYTYLGSLYEEAPNTSVSFTDLASTGFTGFAYSVTALRESDKNILYSAPSNFRFVGTPQMIEGTGVAELPAADANVVPVEYYSLDGLRLQKPSKGINIVRMSDGSVRKVLVK